MDFLRGLVSGGSSIINSHQTQDQDPNTRPVVGGAAALASLGVPRPLFAAPSPQGPPGAAGPSLRDNNINPGTFTTSSFSPHGIVSQGNISNNSTINNMQAQPTNLLWGGASGSMQQQANQGGPGRVLSAQQASSMQGSPDVMAMMQRPAPGGAGGGMMGAGVGGVSLGAAGVPGARREAKTQQTGSFVFEKLVSKHFWIRLVIIYWY